MFENPGSKIKVVAKIIFWIGTVVSVLAAIVCTARLNDPTYLLLVFGGAILYIPALFLCGYGEMIENTSYMLDELYEIENNQKRRAGRAETAEKKEAPHSGADRPEKSEKKEQWEDGYLVLKCPYCEETLSFTQNSLPKDVVHCPFCERDFKREKT